MNPADLTTIIKPEDLRITLSPAGPKMPSFCYKIEGTLVPSHLRGCVFVPPNSLNDGILSEKFYDKRKLALRYLSLNDMNGVTRHFIVSATMNSPTELLPSSPSDYKGE
jgi:hypothetical protein